MKKLVGSKSRLLLGIAIFFAIFSISNSCTKTMSDGSGLGVTEGPSGMNTISIQGSAFSPAEITVPAGTIITWTNNNGVAESITDKSGQFDGIISSNGTYSYLFSTAGTFQYFSRMNPSMAGKVIVN
jgi:plastocyanin